MVNCTHPNSPGRPITWAHANEIPVEVASDFLQWAFESGRLQPEDYFGTLCSESSIPRLKSKFFEAPPDQMFWDNVKHEGPWAAGFFPLSAWDDVLIIGTYFADVNLNLTRKARLVLCEPIALNRHAKHFLSKAAPSEPIKSDTHSAAVIQAPVVLTSYERPFDPASILSHSEEPNTDLESLNEELPTEDKPEAPQGLILDFAVTEAAPSPVLATETRESEASPSEALAQNRPSHEAPALETSSEEWVTPQAATPPPLKPKTAEEVGPITQPVATSETTSSFKLSQEQLTKLFSIPLNQLEPVHLDECRNLDALGAQSLLQTSITFQGTMLLLMKPSDTGVDRLTPWKWNDLLLSIKRNQTDPIDLSTPSLFSIVQRTSKPFHGPVTDSAVSRKFFNDFYRGQKPSHITLVPLIADQKLIGMLLGSTDGRIENRQSLRLMERLAAHFSRRYQQIRSTGNGRPFPINAA